MLIHFLLLHAIFLMSPLAFEFKHKTHKKFALSTAKIVGGRTISIREAPYHVQILRYGIYICSGSIISIRSILTAAHCLTNTAPSNLEIIAGSDQLLIGVRLKVQRFFIASEYTVDSYGNCDIAIIALKTRLVLSDRIKLVKLPSAHVLPKPGSFAMVTGHGLINETTKAISSKLKVVDLPMVEKTICKKFVDSIYNKMFDGSQFCLGFLNVTDQDACEGDSGAPAVFNGKQFGLVSWGYGCGHLNTPGVYANVAYKIGWIRRKMRG